MKKILLVALLLLFSCNIGCIAASVNKTTMEKNVITVSNAGEFLAALGSDRTIIMKPGQYDLTAFDPFVNKEKKKKLSEKVFWQQGADGGALVLHGIKNLTIRGILSEFDSIVVYIAAVPDAAAVLNFSGCNSIYLENIIVKHENYGSGRGNTLYFADSSDIYLKNVKIYGYEKRGLELEKVSRLRMDGSCIFSSKERIMAITDGQDIKFTECLFLENKGPNGPLVDIVYGLEISFLKCKFEGNEGLLLHACRDSSVTVKNSIFKENLNDGIKGSDTINFSGCEFY